MNDQIDHQEHEAVDEQQKEEQRAELLFERLAQLSTGLESMTTLVKKLNARDSEAIALDEMAFEAFEAFDGFLEEALDDLTDAETALERAARHLKS